MSAGAVAAVDLGATSGRVILGRVDGRRARSSSSTSRGSRTARCGSPPACTGTSRACTATSRAGSPTRSAASPTVASIGIDSWAVDYALLRGDRLLGEPFHYRDERNERGVEAVHARRAVRRALPPQRPAVPAVQHALPARRRARRADASTLADSLLLVPDLIGFQLTGAKRRRAHERVDDRPRRRARRASGTTSSSSGSGSRHPCSHRSSTPASRSARLRPAVAAELGAPAGIEVVAVGSHDTASAVVAVPMRAESAAYISCGTWGLVGVELEQPVTTDAAREANFTNEGGVDGRVRFLHNVMGLWLLSESVRWWERDGETIDLPELLAAAASVDRAASRCSTRTTRGSWRPATCPAASPSGAPSTASPRRRAAPSSRARSSRASPRRSPSAVRDAVDPLGRRRRDDPRRRRRRPQRAALPAHRRPRGLPVLAGPVEATAIGNVLVQARAQGFVERRPRVAARARRARRSRRRGTSRRPADAGQCPCASCCRRTTPSPSARSAPSATSCFHQATWVRRTADEADERRASRGRRSRRRAERALELERRRTRRAPG